MGDLNLFRAVRFFSLSLLVVLNLGGCSQTTRRLLKSHSRNSCATLENHCLRGCFNKCSGQKGLEGIAFPLPLSSTSTRSQGKESSFLLPVSGEESESKWRIVKWSGLFLGYLPWLSLGYLPWFTTVFESIFDLHTLMFIECLL